MTYIVNLQSVRCTNRAAFAAALCSIRRQRIRAVLVKKEINEFGHVRTYRVQGRWEASRVADAGYDHQLCTWQS